MNSETKGKVKYNFGSQQLEIISSLLRKATWDYLAGDLFHYYYCLHQAKLRAVSRLNKEEAKELSDIEKKIAVNMFVLKTKRKVNYNVNQALADAIELYDIKLTTLLDSKGFLVPTQKDRTALFGQEEKNSIADPEEDFEEY